MKRLAATVLLTLLISGFWFPSSGHAACFNPAGNAGDTIYNRDLHQQQYCNGGAWVTTGMLTQYAPWPVFFSGAPYLLYSSALTGVTASGMATASFWFRRGGSNGTQQDIITVYSGANQRFVIDFAIANKLQIIGRNSGSTVILQASTNATITDTNWHHVVFSFDLSNAAHRSLYLDDVAQAMTWTTYTNDVVDFAPATTPTASIGAAAANSPGGLPFTGDLADFWFNPGTYIDLSVTANRRYFINASLHPVYLGAHGARTIGVSPAVFLTQGVPENAAAWAVNQGTGGGFTVTAGSLYTSTAGPVSIELGITNLANLSNGTGGTLVINGNYAYQNLPGKFTIDNISNPASPTVAASVTNAVFNHNSGLAVDSASHYAYVCTDQGLVTVDVSNPASPLYVASFNSPSPPVCIDSSDDDNAALAMSGNYLYAADNNNGNEFTIVNASNPLSLTLAGQVTVTNLNGGNDVLVDGSYAYVCVNGNKVTVINVSNPAAPAVSGSVTTNGCLRMLFNPANHNIVYANFNSSLSIVDATNKAAPSLVTTYSGDTSNILAMQGNKLYAIIYSGSHPFTAVISDISNPTSLVAYANVLFPSNTATGALAVAGNYWYMGDNFSSWQFVDGGTCASPAGHEGDVIYNAASYHVPQFCNGTNWIAMGKVPGAGGAGCSSPAGGEGDIRYTGTYRAVQYCDGTTWRAAGNVLPISGLVGWWNLDEGSGTSAADSSGNGNTGTLVNNPTWTTGKINGALNLVAASSQYVNIPDAASLELAGSWTEAIWVNPASVPGSGGGIKVLSKDDAGNHSNYGIAMANGINGCTTGLGWRIYFDTAGGVGNSSCYVTTINTGTWYHVVGEWDSVAKNLLII